MGSVIVPMVSAIFVWWFFTGAILLVVRYADRRGGGAHLMAVLAGLPLLALGVAGVAASLGPLTQNSVYAGFLGALAIWGWIELTFLAGVVTGPLKVACPPDVTFGDRFNRAFASVAHHELLLLAGLLALLIATDGSDNRMALETYSILFLARISAKLNLFFGVPRINTEFIPAKLEHLKSYFRQGPITLAFPIGITFLTGLFAVCAERLIAAGTPVTETGFALLTALSALALLEHWLMVVPLPDAKLWRWMLPAPKPITTKDNTHGF